MADITQKYTALQALIEELDPIPRKYFFDDVGDFGSKIDGTLITAVDVELEKLLMKHIATLFPGESMIGEESGTHEGGTEFVWYVDPIDGTDNFIRRIPFFSISVARLGRMDENSFGIVHNPITGQTFKVSATEKRKSVEPPLGKNFITIGRGQKPEDKIIDYSLRRAIAHKFGRSMGIGSAALELSYVGAGRLEGFFSLNLKSWDIAAGLLIARTAGALVSEFKGNAWKSLDQQSVREICAVPDRTLFVSMPHIHSDVLGFVQDLRRFI